MAKITDENKKISGDFFMKKAFLPTLCILLCTLCILFIPTEAEASIYEDTVRLHILAPSDSAEDQNLKLKIRDMILKEYGSLLKSASDQYDATDKIRTALPAIKSDCERLILDTGYDYSVSAELKREWFNTREYNAFSLPSGNYTSLTVTIGEGAGQNWWCVMYPPICLDASLSKSSSAYSESEVNLITGGGYKIKFKLLEMTAAVFENHSKKLNKRG